MIGSSGVIIRRVQPNPFVVGGKPAEHSFLSNGRAAAHAHQQKRKKQWDFCVSHSVLIFGGANVAGNPPSGFCLVPVSCPLVQLFPASSVSGSAATEIWPWGALFLALSFLFKYYGPV